MIARLQKLQLLETAVRDRIQAGRIPHLSEILARIQQALSARQFGAPFTRVRAAVVGQPVGGTDGRDLERTFSELVQDMELLYSGQVELASRVLDGYDIFASRRDRLAQKLSDLLVTTDTLLAQVSAGSRTAVVDSFTTLTKIDPDQSTVDIDLAEGIATLPANSDQSLKVDGSRVKLVALERAPGTVEPGPAFSTVLSSYRTDAWYCLLPAGGRFGAVLDLTGSDLELGAAARVPLNAIRIEPTGPLSITIEWSPDQFNWHALQPAVNAVIRDRTTFHFAEIGVGYLRIRLAEAGTTSTPGKPRPVGIKTIEFLRRGFTSSAQLYSREYQFTEVVHTVVVQNEAQTPVGTRIDQYVAQSPTGPWTSIVPGQPVTFDNRLWVEAALNQIVEEDATNPATFWQFPIDPSQQPLPGTGELIAGRNQIRIDAYSFDWRQVGDKLHVPTLGDWAKPLGEVRSGVFQALGGLYSSGDDAIAASGLLTALSPVAIDTSQGRNFLTFAVIGPEGNQLLQSGYNYRIAAALWCPVATTLDQQAIGVVNPKEYGGTGSAVVAPLSLWVNGAKLFQSTTVATAVDQLSGAAFQCSLPLQAGWNQLELLVQIPADLQRNVAGVANQQVHVYLQPNLFGANVEQALGVRTVQAWSQSWPRVSEFDLRYNVPPGVRGRWAWKSDVSAGNITAVLLNHDPRNSRYRTDFHPSYTTIDGVNASFPVNLLLRYPVERPLPDSQGTSLLDPRSLYYRADFFLEPGAAAPPVLQSYRMIVN